MPTANEKLADLAVSHQIYLQRYGGSVVRRIMQLLNRSDVDLFARLTEALERLPPESFTVQRLDQMLVQVQRLNAEAYRAAGEELDGALLELAGYEASYQHRVLQSVLPAKVADALVLSTVSPNQVYAAAMARPFQISRNRSVLIGEYLSGLSEARARAVRDAVRIGFVEGQTIDQIVRRIRGTRSQGYADGLMEISRRDAEGMVRTAINHVASVSRQMAYEANSDIVGGWVFLATLDSRVTVTCASLSGREFPLGRGPQPPRHVNCRSTSIPKIMSWRELGLSDDEIDPGTRASLDGQVPADLSFSDWLRSKPAKLQDEVLGATRGEMFRAKKITVDRFTDNRGRVYTLDELRKKDRDLFED